MSRNFELMNQFEIEARGPGKRVPVVHDRILTQVASDRTSGAFWEETLRLVQRVFFSANGGAPRHVVFCGVDDDSGSSSVCAYTARTLVANSSVSVCLVDANIRFPRLSDIFGVSTTASFSRTSEPLREQCVKVGSNLWLASPELLADGCRVLLPVDVLKKRFSELRELFGYVLISAPATNICGDAQLLGQVADATVLVIEANGTRRLTARKAMESLDMAGVRLLGTVLHNRSFPIPEVLYKRL